MPDFRWTDEQAEAIIARGHVLLAASAGTGKTTTLVGKILWLLGLDVGVRAGDGQPLPPCPDPCTLEEIAAITFTEKAAFDLKAKLRKEIERSARAAELRWEIDRASVGTIHAFCAELLREHALRLGIDPTFRVLDERETRLRQEEIVHEVLLEALARDDARAVDLVKDFRMYGGPRQPGAIGQIRAVLRDLRWRSGRYRKWTRDGALDTELLRARAAGPGPAAREEDPEGETRDRRALARASTLYRLALESQRRWLRSLEEENVRDFDSLILDVRRLLHRTETRPALESIRNRYRTLIIDEFQDTDSAQREIAFAIAGLAGPDGAGEVAQGKVRDPTGRRPRLFLVGDPKQSIYGFRGADIAVWNSVRAALCGDRPPLRLSRNFRSEPRLVEYVNRIASAAMGASADALTPESPETRVDYSPLVPARPSSPAVALEWLPNDDGKNRAEQREAEGRRVASRIRGFVGQAVVTDPNDGEMRPCAFRDIAVLARTRDDLAAVEHGLKQYGIPRYNASTAGLGERQEIIDLLTVLRLISNRHDDLRAFGYLRSPFVGLRDEVLARIRLDPATGEGGYLLQARRYLERAEAGETQWYAAPESRRIAEVERQALRTGLDALRDAQVLADRARPAELLQTVLERTGYRLQWLLRDGGDEALANIERFLALLEEYRHLPVADFLALWDRWGEGDLGLPQAPLFSKADDVVTLHTIHTAKGLEWPVVFLVGTRSGQPGHSRLTGRYWSDPAFGPVLMPRVDERGPRSRKLAERALLQQGAEEARLLYVALTRARDRLVISGPTERRTGYSEWLGIGLDRAAEEHAAAAVADPAASESDAGNGGSGIPRRRSAPAARVADPATGTGRQIDAFGFDRELEDERGQFDLFAVPTGGGAPTGNGPEPSAPPMVIYRQVLAIQTRLQGLPIDLSWLEGIEPGDLPPLAEPLPEPPRSFSASATELRLEHRRREEWIQRYVHGVEPARHFAPESSGSGPLSPALRGTLIHGVLERIETARELSRVLDETLAEIGSPELEDLLAAESSYRLALEREIEAVVRGPQWRWYVEGHPYRELSFVHLAGRRSWRLGAFDLFRPAAGVGGSSPPEILSLFDDPAEERRDADAWIIDFKTHQISADQVEAAAREYEIQARVYREAASAILGAGEEADRPRGGVRVALHFTHPNVAVRM
ncbi:MAG: UvrD-helicase domain-containing protein [Gemmatimonadota bacterium]